MDSLLSYYLLLAAIMAGSIVGAPILAAKVEPWFAKRVFGIKD